MTQQDGHVKRQRCRSRFAVLTFALAFGSVIGGSTARADVAGFYKNNPIRIIVGFGPGGGVDAYSRLLAKYMGDHIPGKPDFVVQNMPGAGSMRAVQSLGATPADGTYIVGFNPGNITLSLTDPDKIKFDFSDVEYLGSIGAETQICYMWKGTGVRTFDELLKRPVVHMGTSAPGSSGYILAAVVRNMFGAKIQSVTGYAGRSQEHLAIERGELDGQCATLDGTPKDWVEGNKINILVRFSKSPIPGRPQVPYIMDVAKLSSEQKQVLALLFSINDMFRPYIMRKDVPTDRLRALQKAFFETVKSDRFIADAKREGRTVQDPLSGAAVAKLVADMYRTPKPIVEKAAGTIK